MATFTPVAPKPGAWLDPMEQPLQAGMAQPQLGRMGLLLTAAKVASPPDRTVAPLPVGHVVALLLGPTASSLVAAVAALQLDPMVVLLPPEAVPASLSAPMGLLLPADEPSQAEASTAAERMEPVSLLLPIFVDKAPMSATTSAITTAFRQAGITGILAPGSQLDG